MKLTAKTIPDFLKQPRQRAGVLVYGPDEGLVRERVKSLLACLLGQNYSPFSVVELTEASFKENETCLFEELGAMGLMAEARVVVVRNVSDKIAKHIEAAVSMLDANNYLIVADNELTPRSPMRQLFEQHQQLAALPCYRDEAHTIANTVRAGFAAHQKNIRPDAMHALCARLGNDRAITQCEVEKIALYALHDTDITLAMVDALVPDNSEHESSDIAFALVAGDARAFDIHVGALLRDGTQPVAILRGIGKHIQRLLQCHSTMQQGASLEDAMKQLKPPVFFKEETRFREQIRALSSMQLQRLLKRVTDAEAAIKSGRLAPEIAIADIQRLCYRRTA